MRLSKQTEILKLTRDIPTPFYLLDINVIRQKISKFNEIFEDLDLNLKLLYSVKTNYNPHIIKFLNKHKVGLEIISGFEVDLLQELNLLDEKVVINGPSKSREELNKVIAAKSIIQTDSLQEIREINEIAHSYNTCTGIGLRIQPNDSNWKRFGIPVEYLTKLIKEVEKKYKNVQIIGLHSHLGTQILDVEAYSRLAQQLSSIAIEFRLVEQLKYINLGGGLPSYSAPLTHHNEKPKPLKDYFKAIKFGLNEILKLKRNINVFMEPGRALVDESMALVCSVMSSNFGRIVLDTGKNDIPSLNIRNHPIYFDHEDKFLSEKDIYGSLCMRSDSFPKSKKVPPLKRGDRALITTVGAYVNSQSMSFIKYQPPIYSFDSSLKNLTFKLIQRRQTIKDIVQRYV